MLSDLRVETVIVAGGSGAVSEGVVSSLATAGYTGEALWRAAGATRHQTAAQLNAAVFGTSDYTYLANGLNFPDALAGAPLAARYGAPLYLTPPTCVGMDAMVGIAANHSNGVVLLGGTGALSPAVERGDVCR